MCTKLLNRSQSFKLIFCLNANSSIFFQLLLSKKDFKLYTLNIRFIDLYCKHKSIVNILSELFIKDFSLNCKLQLNIFYLFLDFLYFPTFIIVSSKLKKGGIVFILFFEQLSINILVCRVKSPTTFIIFL